MPVHLRPWRGTRSTLLFAFAFACWPKAGIGNEFSGESGVKPGSEFVPALKPFFAQYCNDCHAEGSEEGGLTLDRLTPDLDDRAMTAAWERIYDRVASGEMPPSESDQPTDAERAKFVAQLGKPLSQSHTIHKGTGLRRLNRREYQNTLNDLFGTQIDLERMFPADGRTGEFDNVGESLQLSMVQLQRYLDAIDLVVEKAIAKTTSPIEPSSRRVSYAETREGKQFIGKVWKQLDDGAVAFFKDGGYPSGMLRDAVARKSGYYNIRVTGYAYQSESPVTFAIGATSFQRGVDQPTFGYYAFGPGQPQTIELRAWMDERFMIEITPWGINDRDNVIRKEGPDGYDGPGLAIQHVEIEGPIVEEFPSRGHVLIFDEIDRREIEPAHASHKTKSWYQPKFEIVSDAPEQDARRTLQRLASLAFRRPATPTQINRYVELFNQQRTEGAEVEEALKSAVAAIFCSPDFLFLQEPAGWLDDYALASRLSYFLTRTAPDAELLAAAESGELSKDRDLLLKQTQRLLSDPRNDRFIVDFTDAWLNLRDIDFTSPDRNLFPEFDRFLQYSMLEETRQFVTKVVRENRRVRDLIQPPFAMLNNRLAVHYGIEGIDGPELREVPITDDGVRGGLLGQASLMKVSANGTNTSPVVRGVFVTERILGNPPPPPPPGVAGVEPDIRGASTLRELLAKHRDLDSCRNCHAMIDPPGFALESFNPIGGWRERFRSLGEGDRVDVQISGRNVRYRLGPDVDASGELQNGKKFDGFLEFRRLLADNEDLLAEMLTTKLLTFATGREMGFSDRDLVNRLVEQSKQEGHGVKNLIELIVTSDAFRRK
ncbi:MAG: DUF1592 domain-containing protein [Rubripirellula sp.]